MHDAANLIDAAKRLPTLAVAAMLAIALALPASSHAGANKAAALTVTGGEAVAYQCGKLKKVIVRYYSLSDDSLAFVKLTIKNEEFTLPQALSASGARYQSEYSYEWWTKGDEAALKDVRKENSPTVICKESPAAK